MPEPMTSELPETQPESERESSAPPMPPETRPPDRFLPEGELPRPIRRRTARLGRSDLLVAALLAAIMVVAAYFRFIGQNWDDFTHLHPDERFLTGVVSGISPAADLGEYFNTHESGLNPNNRGYGFYVYGTLPLFIVKAASGIVTQLTANPDWTGYNGAHLIGRTVSALADLATLFFLFLLGRRLYNRWVGLLAAALYAGAVLPIQLSHFWTTDAFTTLPVIIAVWFAARVLDEGGWGNYVGFGVALGCAVASRVNVVPLAITLALATLIRLLPTFEAGLPRSERQRLWGREGGGLVLAALVSFVVFRVAQPYAFEGPSIFGILPNMDWLRQMQEVQRQISGLVDMPPNHQWTARTSYLFPWWNMVMWGLGLPLGLAAWASWAWAGVQILRGHARWTRHLLPVVWILLYFGWQGRNWVMTMRYYLPLYPFLALLAAWGLFMLARRAFPHPLPPLRLRNLTPFPSPLRRGDSGVRFWRRARLALSAGLLAVVLAFTLLWGFAFTRIYIRQLTRVQASHWVLQNAPADYLLTIDGVDGSTRTVNLGLANTALEPEQQASLAENATRYWGNLSPRPESTSNAESGVWLTYSSSANGERHPLPMQTIVPLTVRFTAPISGTVSRVYTPHLGDPDGDAEEETLWVSLWDVAEGRLLTEGTLTADFSQGDSPLGQAYDIPLEETVTLVEGREYELQSGALAGAPIIVAGSVIAVEGGWDDPIPYKVCALPPGQVWTPDLPPGLATAENCNGVDAYGMGYYQGLELYMALDDIELKRQTMLQVLNDAEYLTISSNRFYDSLSRIPTRFPMSIRYYEALFNGELGFELVQTFESTFTLGAWTIRDQVLPTEHDVPWWLNEWEAEEAFHVYDHPTVFIFRKADDYDPAVVAQILNSVELATANDPNVGFDGTILTDVIPWTAPQADPSPTALMLPEALREVQFAGGTWSVMFDLSALINRNEAVAVVAWWGLLVVIGWLTWPTLFALFPALADRGYPLAKVAGLLVVAWLVWAAGSLEIPAWTPGGILVALLAVAALSAYFVGRHSAELGAYLRQHWRHLLIFEGLTFLLFLGFLVVRWGNPDLWHPSFGGEKPMDFAYLNAVLRSTVFPPLDPWYAGGYLNYYYFGFVLVGVPIKLLGLFPATAYNLILATLFALTGIGAFSVAFNLASSLRRTKRDGSPGALLGNPWVAGVTALLLAVVLGNLDQIRLLLVAFARTGGWRPVTGEEFLPPVSAVVSGIGGLFSGQALDFNTHWWYWNPTRVIAHTGNAITEIPYFTFLYGDPHAHAIAMPLTLLALGWLLNEVLQAGRSFARSGLAAFLALALGALATGILFPTNSWDWLTYTVLGVFGLTFVNYLQHRAERQAASRAEDAPVMPPGPYWRFIGLFGGAPLYLGWESLKRLHPTRAALLRWGGHLAAFLALNLFFALPFTQWFATAYTSAQLWQGEKTPLWGYLDIHGLFLFLVVSLLIWDTVRYLRAIRVRQLIGLGALVTMVLITLGWIAAFTLAFAVGGYPIALVALPILFWAAILFFRPGQSREMRAVWALVVLAIALTFAVDVVVLSGDIGRQNTVFKFYIQVWLLLSVVGGVAFAWLLRASEWWRGWLRNGWMALATVLFTIAAMYPVLATQAKMIDRMALDAPHTLNGMTFMQYATQGEHGVWFPLEEDYHMLRWMQDTIEGSPVVLEGQSDREYLWGARVSVYTGLPSVIGYNWHQRQQRTLDPLPRLVQQRIANVNTLYDTTDVELAWRLLRFYEVSYLVVGQLERAYYTPEGLAKFQSMVEMGLLEVAFEYGETLVYRVVANMDL